MKILIYGEYFLPIVGGVQTAMNLLAEGLVELNSQLERNGEGKQIEVTIVTGTGAAGMDDSVLRYRIVRQPGLWRLVKLIRQADVIHVAGPCLLPMAIAWLAGRPTVVEHHGYQAICPNGLLFREPSRTLCPGFFGQKQYGKCVRCASATVGLAGGIRSVLLTFPRQWFCKRVASNIAITDHLAKRLGLSRSRTVYYGIEDPNSGKNGNDSVRTERLEVAYVGRLVAEKGLPVLLKAAKRLCEEKTPFRLTFIGNGPERERLQELAARFDLNDSVRFTGDLRGHDLERAVDNVEVVAMPSLWEETAGLSAIEHMMRGRVVVAADIGGLSEVVGEAGLKFAPGDVEALAGCIRKVIDDPLLAARLGSAARDRALRLFQQKSMVQAHVSLYHEAIRRRGAVTEF